MMSEQRALAATRILNPRELLRYTWPPLLASIGGIVVGVTDSVLIAHYSTPDLAGVMLGAAIYELPINALLGGLMAYRILAPRLDGDVRYGREVFGLSTMLRSLLPIAVMLTAAVMAISVAGLLASKNATLSAAFSYSAARAPSLIMETASSVMVITLVLWGLSKIPLVVFLASAPANLLFDYVLVYGMGPAPELGALGSGIGSSLSATLPIPFLVLLIMRKRAHGTVAPNVRANYEGWSKLAWPAVWSAVVDYGGNIAFTMVLAISGSTALAGMRFGVQSHLLAFIVISSASSAALYILGKVYAADPDRLRRGVDEVRRIFLVIGVGVGAVVLAVGMAISPAISPDGEVVGAFRVALLVVAALCPIAGSTYGNVTLLRLFGMTDKEFLSNSLGVWGAQIPVAIVLGLIVGGILPFAGLAAYWFLRWVMSHAQVRKHVLESSQREALVV